MSTFIVLRGWREAMQAQGRLSARTQRLYLRTVIGFLVDHPKSILEITPAEVQASVMALAESPAQRNLLLQSLKSLYRYMGTTPYAMPDPTAEFSVRRQRPKGPPDYLTRDELERLFTAADGLDRRARPTMELLYGTAARIHSVTELEPADVDLRLRTVTFRTTKNDQPYSLPLSPRTFAAVLALFELADYKPRTGKRRPGKLIGVGDESVRVWMRKASAIAGLDRRVYPHLLRHTALMALANDPEVSVAVVTAATGWASPEPYRHYVTARPGPLKDALSKL